MREGRMKTLWAAIPVLLLALLVSACGGGGSGAEQSSSGAEASGGAAVSGEDAGMAGAQGAGAGGAAGEGAMSEEAAVEEAAASAAPETEFVDDEGGVPGDRAAVEGFDRKVVKTAELGIRAEDVRDSAAEAQRVAARFDGSVLSSRLERGDGEFAAADLVISVPSERFEEALDALRNLGKEVTTDAVSGEDVTEEFVDLQSRERNLVAAEESLLRLYDRAKSVDDTLTVQRELTEVRGEIEQVQGRVQYLENRTASSQIALTVEPVARPAPQPQPAAWDPSAVVARAWVASLSVLQAIATAAISVVVFGWWLVPALVAALVWWRRRTSRQNTPGGPTAPDPSQAP